MDLFLALRVIVSLGAVFGALWFGHRWITKGRPAKLGRRGITVVARQGLGAKAGVAIVEAGGRQYLLGVTEHAVTVLDRIEEDRGAGSDQVVRVLATGPVPRPTFGEAFAAAALITGAIPVLDVQHTELLVGAPPSTAPVVLARPARTAPIVLPAAPHPTRRAARAAESTRGRTSPVAGSILSRSTWRQTAEALRNLR